MKKEDSVFFSIAKMFLGKMNVECMYSYRLHGKDSIGLASGIFISLERSIESIVYYEHLRKFPLTMNDAHK
jgi:hypothetical protein